MNTNVLSQLPKLAEIVASRHYLRWMVAILVIAVAVAIVGVNKKA